MVGLPNVPNTSAYQHLKPKAVSRKNPEVLSPVLSSSINSAKVLSDGPTQLSRGHNGCTHSGRLDTRFQHVGAVTAACLLRRCDLRDFYVPFMSPPEAALPLTI